MKTSERFDRALKALIQAFFNDTLAKYHCSACAVGNIVAAGIGCKVNMNINYSALNSYWSVIFSTVDGFCYKNYEEYVYNNRHSRSRIAYDKGIDNINSTGYSIDELMKIEEAFEKNTGIKYNYYKYKNKDEIMQDQFNGLMAVVGVLCEIEGLDSAEYKKAFEYTEDFKPVCPVLI